jgi:hypothetical protein
MLRRNLFVLDRSRVQRIRQGRPANFVVALAVLVSAIQGCLPAWAASDPYAPIVPAIREKIIAQTEGQLSSYFFSLTLDPSARTITGTERIDYLNQTGEPQSTIEMRLFPNADYYDEGGIEIARVLVDGEAVTPAFSAQDTVMTIPLEESIAPGDARHLDIRFATTVPINSSGTFGVFSYDKSRGTWVLADWYPILAGWEPGKGFVLDPPTPLGDPTFSDAAFYDLSITFPTGWNVAATGTETPDVADGDQTTWEIVSGPVREMTLVVDDDFQTSSRKVNGTAITVYTDGNGKAAAGGEIALDEAAKVLSTYSDLFGTYPYDELDLVETEMDGALGISWTGLVFLNGDEFLSGPRFTVEHPERLRFTVAHEVGHQWWGALVGINSNDHSFLLEGLTNYLALVAVEKTEGVEAANVQLDVQCVQPYLRALKANGDGIADGPIDQDPSGPSRGSLIYGKAALGFLAIREEIGDGAFFGAINTWADDFAFKNANPSELLATFETNSGEQLDDIWNFWFESAETTPADVEALVS